MRAAIKTLEENIRRLKIEKRMWAKEPENHNDAIEAIDNEIGDHQKAIGILKHNN